MREGMAWLCGLVFVAAYAQKVEPATIPAHKLSAAPVVDGRVDAAEWAEALKLEPFHNPVRGAPSELPTRAYLGYTDEAIYVAFVCDDPEPQRIQAHQTRRNGDMESDDHVIFAIDPQARGLEPYQFVVNPRGTQGLVAPEGVPENLRWQGDWQAAAQITDTGWSAELRIPFRLLRVPSGQRPLGIALARIIPRRRESYIFPNTGAYYSLRLQTLWQDVAIPRPAATLLLLPYLLGETETTARRARSGIDLKWTPTPSQTALLTLNPDFSSIAADIATVDFSYTEKVLQETRPFFTEGSGFFPGTRVFYSVRVPQVRAGVKLFGRAAALEYGVLGGEYARDAHTTRFAVGRTRYRFNAQSYLGAIFSVEDIAPTERLVGVEGAVGQLTGGGEWQLYGLHARLAPARDGEYTLVSLVREAPPRQLSVYATFTQIAPDYAPRLAFVPERGWRGYEANVAYSDQPASSPVLLAAVRVGFGRRTRYGGRLLDEKVSLGAGVYLRNQTGIISEVNLLRRPPHTDRTLNLLVEWNISDASRSGRAFVSFGEQNGGDSFYWSAQQRAELLPRLRVNLTMEQLQIRYPRNLPRDFAVQAILTVNYELDAERVVGARWVNNRLESGGQSLSTNNFYLSYLQRLRTGQEVLMLLGAPNANRTQSRLAIKLVSPVEF